MAEPSPQRPKPKHDWVSQFDRDLIRAAQQKLRCQIMLNAGLTDVFIIVVDKYFIKVNDKPSQDGAYWINKALISVCHILEAKR